MAKCKNTILNEMMHNAAELIDNQIDYLGIVLEQFAEKNDSGRVLRLMQQIKNMEQARDTIRENAGCWT